MSGYTGRMNEHFVIESLLTFDGPNPLQVLDGVSKVRGILGKPKRIASGIDSPRQFPKYNLEFAKRTVGMDTTIPPEGSLLSGPDGVLYEVVGKARDLTQNRQTYGYAVPLLPFLTLYPFIGDAAGVGGVPGVGAVRFSMWTDSQAQRDGRGEYDELGGEAPAAAWGVLKVTNASLILDGEVYRVTSALLNRENPHVMLRLRRRDS